MVRALWKGKYTSCDFCLIKNQWFYIPLIKLNIYIFSHFKKVKFAVSRVYTMEAWKLMKMHLGFIIGTFFFNREINVYHKLKKTKKQKEQEQKASKKNKKIRKKKKEDILLERKKKKVKSKTKIHIKLMKSLKQRFK